MRHALATQEAAARAGFTAERTVSIAPTTSRAAPAAASPRPRRAPSASKAETGGLPATRGGRAPHTKMDLQSVIAFQKSLSERGPSSEDAQPANPTLRALDAVHKDYLKLHRRATKSYWAQPASPSMARSDSTPSSTPATSPSNAAAEKAAVEGAFFSQPGFWDV